MSVRLPALAAALISAAVLAGSPAPAADAAPGGIPGPASGAKPTPSSAYLEGVDVSVFQGTINWAKVAGAGKRFAVIRASAGTLTKDANYTANRSGARSAGLVVGAYHFANPDVMPDKTLEEDAVREADWFLSLATPASGELLPALDLEVSNGFSPDELTSWVKTWLERVGSAVGVKPMIYTSPNFWKTSMGDTAWFAQNGYEVLWIAHWGVSQPTVPAQNWGGNGWTFWQYTSRGHVRGITGNVDLDRYNGTTFDPALFIPVP